MKHPYLLLIILVLTAFGSISSQELDSVRTVDPVQLSGSMSIGGFFYNTTRERTALQPSGYAVNANANLRLYGLSIPFSLVLNQQGSSFQNPFNRFGMSPTYKSATVHLGHRNLNWSPFLLSGTTLFGAGLEWNPYALRVGVAFGTLENRPRFFGQHTRLPAYKRKVRAYKVGFGSEKSYLDFMLVKGKDDINSLSEEPDSIRNLLSAQENFGIGISSRFNFFKDRLTLSTDIAASIFTEDLRFDTINFDTIPAARWASEHLIPVNASSNATYAGESSLRWQANNFSLATIYRRVMPEYKAFGANYLLTDLEAITVNPSFSLWEGKLNLGGSFGLQYNNLDKRLLSKTKRNIGSLDVNIAPANHWGIFAQYSNYSLNQQVLLDSLQQDSFVIDQINHNFSLAPRYSILSNDLSQHFFLNFNYQLFNDQNTSTESFGDNNLFLCNLNYVLHFRPLDLTVNAGVNYLQFSSNLIDNRQTGVQLGLQKQLWSKKLSLRINGQFTKTMSNDFMANNLLARLGATYKIQKSSSLSLQYYLQNNNNETHGYRDTRGQLSWRWRW